MSNIGKTFSFRVYSEAEHTYREFELMVNDEGWVLPDVRGSKQFDAFGPGNLVNGTVVPEMTRQALAELHASRAGVSDRIFQSRLSAIATSMSGVIREA